MIRTPSSLFRFAVPLLLGWVAGCASVPDEAALSAEEVPPPETALSPTNAPAFDPGDPYGPFLALSRSLLLVRDRYVEPLSYERILAGAVDGLFSSLDPYCQYLTSDGFNEMEDDAAGRYCGIGVTVSPDPDGLFVEFPDPRSPAYRAGVRMGDIIHAIDMRPCAEMGFDEATDMISGEAGTVVTLDLEHEDGSRQTVSVHRAHLQLPTVDAAQILTNGIGYLAVTQFGETTAEEFEKAVRLLGGTSLRGLVIDLRDNPGGYLDTAVAMASLVLPKGAVVARTRGRVPEDDDHTYRAAGQNPYRAIPLAILVNVNSASASELLSGALRDHGRAVLVGERTFGKACVQSVFEIPGVPDGKAKLTTAWYYTPKNSLIHGKGLEPDLAVPQTRDECWNARLRHLVTLHPELAFSEESRAAYAAAPDAPLDAAVAHLLESEP